MSRLWKPEDLLYELAMEEPADLHVETMARRCGADVWYQALDGCEANILGYGDRAVITVNENSLPGRQRFSVGHELGHWMFDRGTQAFSCNKRSFWERWFSAATDPEERANRFATELLLPRFMFEPRASDRPITFATVRELAATFQMSLTATAIRLVELGSDAAIIYCTQHGRRRWFNRSPGFPDDLWPRDWPGRRTLASDLLNGAGGDLGPAEVAVDGWIEHERAADCRVIENSIRLSDQLILTLLWWKDYEQLVDLVGEEDLLY